jgi:hypothetical protein
MEASPEVARSVQASENRWRAIAREYGLLDSRAVAALLGGNGTNRNKAHQLAKEGKIIGVKRGGPCIRASNSTTARSGRLLRR